jgi:polar amino acid transport system substrate-binding protein
MVLLQDWPSNDAPKCAMKNALTEISPRRAAMKRRAVILSATGALFTGVARAQPVPLDARAQLVPTGRLRVSVHTLPFIATRNASGQAQGAAVDLCHELGRVLGVPVEIRATDTPVEAIGDVRDGKADLTPIVNLPERAKVIDFTPNFADFSVSFLVRPSLKIHSIGDLDQPGRRVVAFDRGLVFDKLRQELHAATIVGSPIGLPRAAFDKLVAGEVDAYAEVRHLLTLMQPDLPDSTILPGSLMNISVAFGYPMQHPAAGGYLASFIREKAREGFIQAALSRAGIQGASVPPG